MAQPIILGSSSVSSSTIQRKEITGGDQYYQWESLKSFVFIAEAFNPTNYNFNSFTGRHPGDSLYTYTVFAFLVGMPYMYMEFFIRQYTGKIDFNENLNPLLKALNYGTILVSLIHCFMHSDDLASSVSYLIASVHFVPPFADCTKIWNINPATKCIQSCNLTMTCPKHDLHVIRYLSTFYYYKLQFQNVEQAVFTRRFFLSAVLWIANFFISTVSDQILVKVFYLSFIIKTVSVVLLSVYILLSAETYVPIALGETFRFSSKDLNIGVSDLGRIYSFGVGLVGVHDFGTMSPFTNVGKAVLLYTVVRFILHLIRIVAIQVSKHVVTRCTKFSNTDPHYFIFATMPMAADFFFVSRMILICIYVNMVLGLGTHRVAITVTITKMMHNVFSKVKGTYMSGIICFIGCLGTIMIVYATDANYPLQEGLHAAMLALACLKSAIIVYLYGIRKLSTDIHFWLGEKPSKYWTVTWSVMPIFFLWMSYDSILNSYRLLLTSTIFIKSKTNSIVLASTFGGILIIVLVFQLRTTIKYIVANKLSALFKPNIKYGPADADDRRLRRRYNETLTTRVCTHNCNALDDKFDCDHSFLLPDEGSGVQEFVQLFKADDPTKTRVSEMMDYNLN